MILWKSRRTIPPLGGGGEVDGSLTREGGWPLYGVSGTQKTVPSVISCLANGSSYVRFDVKIGQPGNKKTTYYREKI
jgi:hypothetical protein